MFWLRSSMGVARPFQLTNAAARGAAVRSQGTTTTTTTDTTSSPHTKDPAVNRLSSRKHRRKWIDSLRIYCVGGDGGNGLPQSGGQGGQGGQVMLKAANLKHGRSKDKDDVQPNNLYDLFVTEFEGDSRKQRLHGEKGGHASKYRLLGKQGDDKLVEVPLGVTISDDRGRHVYDLDRPGAQVVVASGGAGGARTNGWSGQRGQRHHIRLELKMVADVGLVGFPNAGKSTFLKAVSRSQPKIAAYPFTTIKPNLGHLDYGDGRRISLADLPGLIEGAHYNVGMGHRFLKHVERTRLMLFVVDVQGFRLNAFTQFRSAAQTLLLLNRELELYSPDLLRKPALCLVNKMDTEGAPERLAELQRALGDETELAKVAAQLPEDMRPEQHLKFQEVIPISAKKSRRTVNRAKNRLRLWIDQHADVDKPDYDVMADIEHDSIEKGPVLI